MASPLSLITPLDPGGIRRHAPAAPVMQQAACTTAFRRLEAAVASARGSRREANQDAHSALRGRGRIFIVADGVGGGAMARMASAQLVLQLQRAHSALAQAAPGARQRRQPAGHLETEAAHLRRLHQRACQHRRVHMLLRQLQQAAAQVVQAVVQQLQRVARSQHHGGVDHVLAGTAPVHVR